MSSSRIKTIAIAALVLINVFFLTFIIIDTLDDVLTEREMMENVCAVLRAGGIELSPDDVKTSGAIRTMRTGRVLEAEEIIAYAMLGPTTKTDQGIIYLYENNSRGSAEFASAGDFEIRLYEGVITNENGTMRTVEGLLREMRIEWAGMTVTLDAESETETVSVLGAFRDVKIFNCTIGFYFARGSLQTVSGRFVAGIELADDGVAITHVSRALLGFLSEVRREEREDVIAEIIYSVEPGYRHRVVGSFGEGLLSPSWLLATDAGRYIVDDASGEVLALGQ